MKTYSLLAAIMLVVGACSAQQIDIAAPLNVATADDEVFVLANDLEVKARRSAATNLRAGTRWTKSGDIEQGSVYDTKDQVVIVNSFDVHEASIVVDGGNIVGYFLKLEGTFVAAEPVPIVWQGE